MRKLRKFKIRVARHHSGKYCIKYSNSIIPIWLTLIQWTPPISYDRPLSDGWHPFTGTYIQCKQKIKEFKCIEDIREFRKKNPENMKIYESKIKNIINN
jgi:hypothetical protein